MGNEQYSQAGGVEEAQRLGVGCVIKTSSIKNFIKTSLGGWVEFGYSAGKGKLFVLALLGLETKDGKNDVDIQKAMNSIGWVNLTVDWVECSQFLVNYRYWEGDARDLGRVLLNLEDWGMTKEQIEKLGATFDWNKDSKEDAWVKVYREFKRMYREAVPLKPVAINEEINEIPEKSPTFKTRAVTSLPPKKKKGS